MIQRLFLISVVLLLFVRCGNNHELKKQKSQLLEEMVSEKILTIAVLMAQQINGDELEILLNKYPEKDDIKTINDDTTYSKMQKTLNFSNKLCEHNPTISILVYNQQKDVYQLTVMNTPQPYWRHEYDELDSEWKDIYSQSKLGYGVFPKITDENGDWISAFHEIKNSNGERVGIIQADADLGFYKYWLED